MVFPIGVPLKPSPYIQALESYSTPNISGSRPWPFKVKWHHRSHDDPILHMQFPISAPLEPTRYLQAFSRYLAPNISGSRPWPFGGHVTSLVMWRFDFPYRVSYWCSIGTKTLSPSVFEIFGSKYIGVTTLTFWGSRGVIGHVTIWCPYSISYRRSIVTDSLSTAVFEILGPKHIGVSTLTFQGHVTSPITITITIFV